MAQRATAGRIAQFFGDALLGLALFTLMVGLCTRDGGARAEARMTTDAAAFVAAAPVDSASNFVVGLISQAGPQASAMATGYPESYVTAVFRQTTQNTALGLLAIVFSALVALNLGFWRHLRRTYAPTW